MEITLKIEGMKCNHCAERLQRSFNLMDGVKSATVNLESRLAVITFDDKVCSVDSIKECVFDAGFKTQC